MRVLVTGPRGWTDEWSVAQAFDEVEAVAWFVETYELDTPGITLVHGGAKGLDTLAAKEAKRRGWTVEEVRPDYKRYPPKIAPHLRNQTMVDRGAYVCLAFLMVCEREDCPDRGKHNTHGTADCMRRAAKANITTWRYQV